MSAMLQVNLKSSHVFYTYKKFYFTFLIQKFCIEFYSKIIKFFNTFKTLSGV